MSARLIITSLIAQTMLMRNYYIYGALGWCLEVIWTGMGSLLSGDPRLTATTYLWMFPIYGLAVFFEPVHDRIRPWPTLIRGLFWMFLFFAVEYLTGWFLRILVGTSPWDYSGAAFHVQGLIRLDYAPVWFFLGLLYEKLHDWLQQIEVR
ncbi:putative ABC transporter permease [Sporomusa acidovorans]|uniref:ABC-transporter type IV n=1 Tax=Sporomusa acidovorans (strain ATCC 49682 / DSM 3132 / Mol) TaxID=1123286 RepID=A0ABZ3J9F5_SPOA4|nr:putative ABC transporter permease [Sporomusa acidovorans]OZC16070.1 hypothetical protein SPACI_44370 [Sporomusa acidovorans DSM 3132]SDD87677.1 Putative ABC-transporter type IV [Sporomusa acidovorans]